MRKIILVVLFLSVAVAAGIYVFSRKAPQLLRDAIARSINKSVSIDAIEYRFPGTFELRGFRILESREPFINEVCFSVDKVLLDVSPLSLSQEQLIIDKIDVREALVVVRNRGGKLYHALSDAMTQADTPAAGEAGGMPATARVDSQLPLLIHRFHLGSSRFQFVDYDVQDTGFVVELDQIEANLRHIAFPPQAVKTVYRVDARLAQGRGQKAAAFEASGWTVFGDYDTDALFRLTDLSLPYFRPYYSQVSPAEIEEGWLSSRASLRIVQKQVTANIDLELAGLYFKSYESGDELFGLKADEILSFLKDRSGRLQFPFVLQWELGQRGVEKREIVRRAIERSLKRTLIGNVGNVLERTLGKLSGSDMDPSKDDWEDTLKKVKKLFR